MPAIQVPWPLGSLVGLWPAIWRCRRRAGRRCRGGRHRHRCRGPPRRRTRPGRWTRTRYPSRSGQRPLVAIAAVGRGRLSLALPVPLDTHDHRVGAERGDGLGGRGLGQGCDPHPERRDGIDGGAADALDQRGALLGRGAFREGDDVVDGRAGIRGRLGSGLGDGAGLGGKAGVGRDAGFGRGRLLGSGCRLRIGGWRRVRRGGRRRLRGRLGRFRSRCLGRVGSVLRLACVGSGSGAGVGSAPGRASGRARVPEWDQAPVPASDPVRMRPAGRPAGSRRVRGSHRTAKTQPPEGAGWLPGGKPGTGRRAR